MDTKLFDLNVQQGPSVPKEGDLFKVIRTHGATFEIRYGYYEESDKAAMFAEPVEIYPNFTDHPHYTDDGIPFATAMQIPCKRFKGEKDEDSTCGDCSYYQKCEELLGICTCEKNRKQAMAEGRT